MTTLSREMFSYKVDHGVSEVVLYQTGELAAIG